MQSRFKGLCVFITWLQLPQVLQGKELNLLVMIMALLFLKMSLFSFSFFCFGSVFGQADAVHKITGSMLCVSTASPERVQNQ